MAEGTKPTKMYARDKIVKKKRRLSKNPENLPSDEVPSARGTGKTWS